MNRTTKRIGALGTTIVAVGATGVAFAAWTATGVGTGAAKATHEVVTVATASAPTADLFPGGSAGALVVNVSNTNSGDILLSAVAADPAATTAQLKGSGCTTNNPDLSLNATAISTYITGLTVSQATIGHGSSKSFTIPGAVSMGTGSDNSCQDASLTYPVQVTAVTP